MLYMSVKSLSFNGSKIMTAKDRVSRKVLSRQGAYLRGIAKRMIRFKKNKSIYSMPGNSPFTHSKTGLKQSIIFAADDVSVVIGTTFSGIGTIGGTHEHGGVEPGRKVLRGNNWIMRLGGHGPIDIRNGELIFAKLTSPEMVRRSRELLRFRRNELKRDNSIKDAFDIASRESREKPRKYPSRPFMGPALSEGADKLPEFWKLAIR